MQAPIIFDRKAIRQYKDRAADTLHHVAPVFEAAADILLDRLNDITRTFDTALDIGGKGFIAPHLAAKGITVVQCESSLKLARATSSRSWHTLCADEEQLPFAPESFDLVTASLSLHSINDLPGTLSQIRHILRPDGLLLASIPILPTLRPLKQALENAELALCDGLSPRVAPLPTQHSCAALLQRCGFALPVVDTEIIPLRYKSLTGLLQDLRHAGESNALAFRSKKIPPRMLFPAADAEITYDEDGRFAMPLHMAVLTAWSPAPTQPKPLQPGQFTHSLESALNAAHPDQE